MQTLLQKAVKQHAPMIISLTIILIPVFLCALIIQTSMAFGEYAELIVVLSVADLQIGKLTECVLEHVHILP